MRMRFYIAILFSGLLYIQISAQHYSLFSQYVVNGLVINPAYAGKNEVLDATATHRRQWTGFNGAPATTAFSLNTPLRSHSSNAGICFQDDRLGASSTQYLSGMYAYRFQFGKMKVSLGLQAGVLFSKANWSELRRNDAGDLLLENASQNKTGFFTGSGLYLHNEKFFGGISAPWMFSSLAEFRKNPLILSAGYVYSLSENHQLKPSFLVRRVKSSPMQFDLNVNYYYKQRFGIGASWRYKESVVAIFEYQVNTQFKFAYSYDIGMNKLSNYHNGSHEIMLRYFFGFTQEARDPRAFLY
jgi:type IX secretion system PorP/SprF family membrane protein